MPFIAPQPSFKLEEKPYFAVAISMQDIQMQILSEVSPKDGGYADQAQMRPTRMVDDTHQGQGMMAPPSQSQRSHHSNSFHLSSVGQGEIEIVAEERPNVGETSMMDHELSEDSAFLDNPLML